MRENNTHPHMPWRQMPTEELDAILQAELKLEHPHEEVVLPILQELEERERDYPMEVNPVVLEKLHKFSEHKTSSIRSKGRDGWLAGIAVVAAICVIIMAVPWSAGADSLFGMLCRWTSSVFEFFTPGSDVNNPPVDVLFETDHPGLQKLYDKVTELGATESVVPSWLPDGFTLTELKVELAAEGTKVHGCFENGTDMILFTYVIATDIRAKIEREDTVLEVYDYADVSHFIVDNGDNLSVTWTVDGVECLLSTDVSEKDTYTIIKSIYRSELS